MRRRKQCCLPRRKKRKTIWDLWLSWLFFSTGGKFSSSTTSPSFSQDLFRRAEGGKLFYLMSRRLFWHNGISWKIRQDLGWLAGRKVAWHLVCLGERVRGGKGSEKCGRERKVFFWRCQSLTDFLLSHFFFGCFSFVYFDFFVFFLFPFFHKVVNLFLESSRLCCGFFSKCERVLFRRKKYSIFAAVT